MGNVLLVRHGATEFNKGGESAERIRGWLDIPLDQEGLAEAERLSKEFEDYDIIEIFSSPLKRAEVTAQKIARRQHIGVRTNISLLPWNLGFMHGQKVSAVIATMKKMTENEDEIPQGGEPFEQYRKRFLEFLKRKTDEALNLSGDDFICLVTHSRGMQLTAAWAAAGFPDDLSISVQRMNDYEHEVGTGGSLVLKCKK